MVGQEDLAIFGYKLNMKVKYVKKITSIFLATYLNHGELAVLKGLFLPFCTLL
jgi:hypothetical protein